MTDNTQPEALKLADALEAVEGGWSVADKCCAELRRQHARIAELEAQLEAIGAGGVSGPLIGQPQAMPDLSALTERGATAWTAVDAQALREGRWYLVNKDGMATLCADQADAEQGAKEAQTLWPHMGPHRAVQLFEADGRASHGQAPAQAAPAAVDHDEDLLEKLYWEFDSQRKKTGEERLAFKVKMRFYASEFLRRSDGKMTFAQSVSDDMMNLADRLGSEFDDVDPRAWKHLLVYAPKAAPAGATKEVENLRKALVYVAFALHDTPQYMLAQGITLINDDTVRVSRDGWTVEASVNPHRQPAPVVDREAVIRAAVAALLDAEADSQPAPEYVGNGMFKGETIEKAAEHWANWCDVRCMTGLSEFLRVVAARKQGANHE